MKKIFIYVSSKDNLQDPSKLGGIESLNYNLFLFLKKLKKEGFIRHCIIKQFPLNFLNKPERLAIENMNKIIGTSAYTIAKLLEKNKFGPLLKTKLTLFLLVSIWIEDYSSIFFFKKSCN